VLWCCFWCRSCCCCCCCFNHYTLEVCKLGKLSAQRSGIIAM
jgi:hypothetical protein